MTAAAVLNPLTVSYVEPDTLDDAWAALEPMVQRALRHGQNDQYTTDSLKESVRDGGRQLWVAHEGDDIIAGMIIELVQYPAKRTVIVHMLAGGDMEGWFDERIHLLTEFRDMNGADAIEASCRPGLARFLEKRGWRQKSIIMEAP